MALLPLAAKTVRDALTSDEVDENGRPVVDAKTKLDAAKWVSEHAIGKAMQRTSIEVTPADRVQRAVAAAILLDDGTEDSWLVENSWYKSTASLPTATRATSICCPTSSTEIH